jgi:hypothetical protein
VSNLNSAQFDDAFDIEAQARRRYHRKHEHGYVGNGFWYMNYPYMYNGMGTGGDATAQHERGETPEQETAEQHVGEAMGSATNGVITTAMAGATSDGGGMGGTASSGAGAAGGSPA